MDKFLSHKSLSCKHLFDTSQDMIIKGTLIAKDIDIKVAMLVEITVTSVYYQFEITDWHINCQSIEICFLPLSSDNNQQPIAILVTF